MLVVLAGAGTSAADQPTTIAKTLRSVVSVYASGGEGTAFAYERPGVYLTNAHVVGDAHRVQIQTQNGRRVEATVVAVDPGLDLARLSSGLRLRPLPIRTRPVRIGEDVVAIGSPRGLDGSVTKGVVSATRHPGGRDEIQTDLALNPGNSGGPLLDAHGAVLGVNRSILRDSAGISFAVPIGAAREMAAGPTASRAGAGWSPGLWAGLAALVLAAALLGLAARRHSRHQTVHVHLRQRSRPLPASDPDPLVRIPRLEKEETNQWTSQS